MKNLTVSLVIFMLLGITVLSCRSTCDRTLYYYSKTPVYQDLTSIRNSFEVRGVEDMDTILRIVEVDHAYFLEEKGRGVHVIDKLNFSLPTRTAFISVPGCFSIEAQGDMLYVARGPDIVEVNVGDLSNITKRRTLKDLFNLDYVKNDSFVVGYRDEYIERVIEEGDCAESDIYDSRLGSNSKSPYSPNVELHITKNQLIGCDNTLARHFKIGGSGVLFNQHNADISRPGEVEEQSISSNDEIIVIGRPSRTMLTMSNDGNFLRTSNTRLNSPFSCGSFFLFRDVVFYTDFAEKTDNSCFSTGTLHLHAISNTSFQPEQFQMTEPQHISIHDSTMLLCDGAGGFGIYDISIPSFFSPEMAKYDEVPNVHSKVGVLSKDRALVWGQGGLFYVSVSNPRNTYVITEVK